MKALPIACRDACIGLLAATLLTGLAHGGPISLVGHYTLDDAAGTAIADTSGYGLDGTRGTGNASTGTLGTTHIEGTAAAAFGNNSQHSVNLGVPSTFDFRPTVDEFSISAWFKVPNDTQGTLFSKAVATNSSRQYQLFVGTDGRLSSYIGGTSQVYGSVVDDDAVHHVVLSVDKAGATVYLDGNSDGTGGVGTALNAGQNVYIGARSNGAGYMLTNGWVDDVQFYRGAMDLKQAAYLHATPGATIQEEELLYREVFSNDDGSNRNFSGGTIEGWRANYTSSGIASGGTAIAGGEGSQAWLPVNSNPDHSSLTDGFYLRSTYSANYLHWTEELVIDDVDQIRSFQWDQSNGASDILQAAVRLDVDGTPGNTADDEWYVSSQTFTNADGDREFLNGDSTTWHLDLTFEFAGAEWLELNFTPNTTLALTSNVATLPGGSAVTAFGFYSPDVPGHQYFDNFRVWQVPEPNTLGLLLFGGLMLMASRRRRQPS